jgi:hypothetical protein
MVGRNATKSFKTKMTYKEIPVRYKKQNQAFKVSGTIKGTIMAGIKIIGWIFKYTLNNSMLQISYFIVLLLAFRLCCYSCTV